MLDCPQKDVWAWNRELIVELPSCRVVEGENETKPSMTASAPASTIPGFNFGEAAASRTAGACHHCQFISILNNHSSSHSQSTQLPLLPFESPSMRFFRGTYTNMRVSRPILPSPRALALCRSCRARGMSSSRADARPRSPPAKPSARWLSETKARIGKCIIFGMDRPQTRRAGGVLKALGEEWRELVAGREGFLTTPKRAGLLRRRVVWGEMDSMVREYFVLFLSGLC